LQAFEASCLLEQWSCKMRHKILKPLCAFVIDKNGFIPQHLMTLPMNPPCSLIRWSACPDPGGQLPFPVPEYPLLALHTRGKHAVVRQGHYSYFRSSSDCRACRRCHNGRSLVQMSHVSGKYRGVKTCA
jgi:hypothetical protein